MKTTITLSYLILTMIFNNVVFAQNKTISDNPFVRVYNLEGEKIFKGKVIAVSDTLLQLKKNGITTNINFKDIGIIKTKRSEGNNVFVGGIIGATSGAIIGAASADPNDFILPTTAGEGAAIGAIFGGGLGAGIGGLTILFKKSKRFSINGEVLKWKSFKEAISN